MEYIVKDAIDCKEIIKNEKREQNMEKFEEDVKNGEVVDVLDYLPDESVDYSNGVTKIGNKISNGISDVMTKGLSGLFDALKGLFW